MDEQRSRSTANGDRADAARRLSAREREVLALVAAGLTNRGISERLVISIGTADRHVHNILTKLGCTNRTEAAAFARSYGSQASPTTWLPTGPRLGSQGRFVGRSEERAWLAARLAEARAGQGGLTMVVGEPGIGKTRLTEEVARDAAAAGFAVLWGRCYEGDWAPPYVPFAEALTALVRAADLRDLCNDLGFGGPPLARVVPVMRERVPDLPEPTPLGPNEEQFRILDAVAQLLIATAKRRPLLLVIDDLHWADAGTLNMLRYLSLLLKESRICLIGNYRDVELDRQHPLGETLAELRRGQGYERVLLRGLGDAETGEMAESIAARQLDGEFVQAVRAETGGNPLFVREMVLHLIEEGTLPIDVDPLDKVTLTIPESVRQVIGRRLSRLSDEANRLLSAASAFKGPFRFDVTAEAAELEDQEALDAVDAASGAQLIHAAAAADSYDFGHALIAHTLYTELNPSRQVRLHRRIAEALIAKPDASAAEVAYQYQRSAAVPGAEAGVPWALRAADQAESAYAWEQVVAFGEIALELMPPEDPRRPEVTGRLGLALPAARRPLDAVEAMKLWAGCLFGRDCAAEALDYLMTAYVSLAGAGYVPESLEVARFADRHILALDNRPSIWLRMIVVRAAEESAPDFVEGQPPSPERQELFDAWAALPGRPEPPLNRVNMQVLKSRAEVLSVAETHAMWGTWMTFMAGEYRRAESVLGSKAEAALKEGRASEACELRAFQAACLISLGEFTAARSQLALASQIARRLPPNNAAYVQIGAREREFAWALDTGWDALGEEVDRILGEGMPLPTGWGAFAMITASARTKARLGSKTRALQLVELALPAIDKGECGLGNYPRLIGNAAWALWESDTATWAARIEANLIRKVIAPDFRSSMVDARLSVAHLCAVQGRIDEASDWFAKARVVLEEQGARPLRAICDHDEALALVRHSRKTGVPLERERVLALLAEALAQFEDIGMTGWIERAKSLRAEVEATVLAGDDGLRAPR